MQLAEKDFPAVESVDPSQLVKTHRETSIVPQSRPELAFSLTLPNDWTSDTAATPPPDDGSTWAPLGVFAAKPQADAPTPTNMANAAWSTVTVLWRRLEIEVPLDEWAALQIRQLNGNIAVGRVWTDAAGSVVDIGGGSVGMLEGPSTTGGSPNPVNAVMRAMVRANGQDAFMVLGYASERGYASSARDMLIAGASFCVAQPVDTNFETIHAAAATNPSFQVSYPASWKYRPVTANIPGKSGVELVLILEDSLKGYIRIKAIDPRIATVDSMDQLKQDAADELTESGIKMLEPWSQLTGSSLLAIPDLKAAYTSRGIVQDFPYELHFGVLQKPPLLFCVTALITPIDVEPIACLRGRRAYGIAMASVTPTQV